ncbi:MAG: Gfo/Idh/MocA family oxidoreductase [Chloroflexi bacterium]|nr:Gfo/Idh/MocA family oxidoreductase [Chloroflexota bacterium]
MTTYRTAIIGLSWIATDPPPPASDPVLGTSIPYSHAAALAAVPNVEVVAGCDINPAMRDQFLERWSGRWPGAKTYENYREMLAREKPDLVSIVTPDFLHADPFLAAVEHGAKGIFCDKPLATNLADADRMVAAAKAAGTVVNINFTRRWIPQYVNARAILRSGRLGDLSQIIAESGGPRAMLFRNHTHLVDLLCYYADGDPIWVVSELEPGFEDYGTEYKGDGGKTESSEPAANYYVAFANGVRAYLTGMKNTQPDTIVSLRAAKGRITVDEFGSELRAIAGGGTMMPSGAPTRQTEFLAPAYSISGMHAAVVDLITGLETGRPTASPVEHARRTTAIIEAVLQSQAQGNVRVPVAPPQP